MELVFGPNDSNQIKIKKGKKRKSGKNGVCIHITRTTVMREDKINLIKSKVRVNSRDTDKDANTLKISSLEILN